MLEFVRTVHDALGIESTWAFVLFFFLFFGAVGGGSAYLVDLTYKNALAKERSALPKPPTAEEREARHQLRNQIGDLIQRGTIFQHNVLAIGQRTLPNPREAAGQIVTPILQYHIEVIRFAEMNFNHAEAMRVSASPAITDYPKGMLQIDKDGKGGFDLRASWSYLVGDLAALERFLREKPEL